MLAFANAAVVLEGEMALAEVGEALAEDGDGAVDSVLVGDVGDVGREALAEVSRARLALGGRVSSRCSTFMLGRAFCFLRAAAAVFLCWSDLHFHPCFGHGHWDSMDIHVSWCSWRWFGLGTSWW